MNTIQSEWADYNEQVMPDNAPEIQRTEMKKAFYAGAHSVMCVLRALGESEISDEAAGIAFSELNEECVDFLKEVLAKELSTRCPTKSPK